ncbi:MAG: hypothetical protein JO211_17055 [Acidobacteriaceae bacterium]|nr:hypothetical protein [Acidobacteriaceae bacterium]
MASAYGVGLCRDTQSAAGVPGIAAPRVVSVVFGELTRLLIAMQPGQLIKDYTAVADRLAEGLAVPRVRFRPRGHGLIWCELLSVDPLTEQVPLPVAGWDSSRLVLVGCETGEELSVSLRDCAHIIAQGQTRSGKSRWAYGLLAQLAGCPDVLIGGSDITGLLARAFANTRHSGWASGSADIEAHAEVLEALVEEMDRRIAAMPSRIDVYPTSADDPMRFVVIEELAGLITAAAAADAMAPKPKPGQRSAPKLVDRIKGAYTRLLAEGAKAGFRVLILVQRAEAGVIGGFARDQASLRISFRCDNVDSIKMLHAQADRPTAELHATAESAIALVSGPGLPLLRGKAPHMPSYAHFCDLVQTASGRRLLAV